MLKNRVLKSAFALLLALSMLVPSFGWSAYAEENGVESPINLQGVKVYERNNKLFLFTFSNEDDAKK